MHQHTPAGAPIYARANPPPQVEPAALSLPPGGAASVLVRYQPKALGRHAARVAFALSAAAGGGAQLAEAAVEVLGSCLRASGRAPLPGGPDATPETFAKETCATRLHPGAASAARRWLSAEVPCGWRRHGPFCLAPSTGAPQGAKTSAPTLQNAAQPPMPAQAFQRGGGRRPLDAQGGAGAAAGVPAAEALGDARERAGPGLDRAGGRPRGHKRRAGPHLTWPAAARCFRPSFASFLPWAPPRVAAAACRLRLCARAPPLAPRRFRFQDASTLRSSSPFTEQVRRCCRGGGGGVGAPHGQVNAGCQAPGVRGRALPRGGRARDRQQRTRARRAAPPGRTAKARAYLTRKEGGEGDKDMGMRPYRRARPWLEAACNAGWPALFGQGRPDEARATPTPAA
jgi:hypothetical protein